MDRQTDANQFYNLSHAICYSYGTDNNNRSQNSSPTQMQMLDNKHTKMFFTMMIAYDTKHFGRNEMTCMIIWPF